MTAAQRAAHLALTQTALEDQFPATITVNGTSYACAGGNAAELGQTLGPGGYTQDVQVAFRVRKTLLADPPEMGTLLSYEGETYAVNKRLKQPHDVAWFIGCGPVVAD